MTIFVDADSCPKAARDIVLRRGSSPTAAKADLKIIFAANRQIPNCAPAQMILCSSAENAADDRIVELAQKGDIVITRDVPLAKRLVDNEINVIDDRGRVFNANNINEMLSLRNFMVGLADNGLEYERTANYGKKDLKQFADSFDKLITKLLN